MSCLTAFDSTPFAVNLQRRKDALENTAPSVLLDPIGLDFACIGLHCVLDVRATSFLALISGLGDPDHWRLTLHCAD